MDLRKGQLRKIFQKSKFVRNSGAKIRSELFRQKLRQPSTTRTTVALIVLKSASASYAHREGFYFARTIANSASQPCILR